jgi:TRAP-type C4-dicarboxylate transport system permease small subunit
MKARYIQAMDALHRACLFAAGICLVVITIIIPWGVFTRFVLNSASSWPEPLAVLLMIALSFLSAVVCYREYLHIGVGIVPTLLKGPAKIFVGITIELAMLFTNVFMLWYGLKLVQATFHQSIAEFPALSVGITYLPVPLGGLITILFGLERFLTGKFFQEPTAETLGSISTE